MFSGICCGSHDRPRGNHQPGRPQNAPTTLTTSVNGRRPEHPTFVAAENIDVILDVQRPSGYAKSLGRLHIAQSSFDTAALLNVDRIPIFQEDIPVCILTL